ncbi:MAG TPA: xanthine dehydrogenase family protein molybdopterin-binding subunit [Xanthobacteraceae bacterium]|nr:xanthine dehydrogenase family protein molybdopterin-binding subunit [Xanthobacteraceae bacterium]
MSGGRGVGAALPRKEDYRFLTGQGRYLDDVVIAGALHAHFLRSPHAHARIVSIDAAAARGAPGVLAVVTGRELAEWTTPLKMAPAIEGLQPVEAATLPIDRARFIGDPVACVVATDRYLAEDAAELIRVVYDELDAVADMDSALAPGAPRVDETLAGNLVSHQSFTAGDPARRFAEADAIVETTFHHHRLTHAPIETRGCCAVWDEGRRHLTMHIGNQVPHPYRTALARRLRLNEGQVTVISPDIGGGFGQKIAVYREELTVAALARALKRPVRWREDRGENLLAASHAREDRVRTRAAVTREGRILALTLEMREDFGAYCFYPANYLARVVAMILTGPYKISDYAFDVKVVLTNKCGNGPMRAPMAITSWIMDGTVEAIARRLGLDPIEVRRTNMIHGFDLPHRMATGEVLEDVTPRETLERALNEFDLAAFRRRQDADRARGVYRGLGICCVIESTTYGSAFYKAAGIAGSGHEAGWVKVEPSGAVNASVGLMASGQGYETAFAQVVADTLGIDPDEVRIDLGNTDVAPYGMGSRGARGGTVGGSVLRIAAEAIREKILTIAATLLGLNTSGELRIARGRIERHIGGAWSDAGLGLADIAHVAYLDPLRLPQGMEPGLEAHKAYDPPSMTYSNATHLCEAVVDARTGAVTLVRYLVVEDCGTVLNPLIVEGQQHGAIAMGIGGVLLEEIVYDENGQNRSGSFADYLLPTAADIPPIEVISQHTPNRKTKTGSKGMAEGGVMGAIGAVMSAVNDALAPFGVYADRQPLRPDYIRSLLRGKEAAAARSANA